MGSPTCPEKNGARFDRAEGIAAGPGLGCERWDDERDMILGGWSVGGWLAAVMVGTSAGRGSVVAEAKAGWSWNEFRGERSLTGAGAVSNDESAIPRSSSGNSRSCGGGAAENESSGSRGDGAGKSGASRGG